MGEHEDQQVRGPNRIPGTHNLGRAESFEGNPRRVRSPRRKGHQMMLGVSGNMAELLGVARQPMPTGV
jgi:hypothetical protein